MATETVAGNTGSAALIAAEAISWTADVEYATSRFVAFNSGGWRESVQTVKGVSGSCEFQGVTLPTATAILTTLVLITSTESGAPKLTGNAYITNIQYQSEAEGIVTFTADFEYTGEVTLGVAA